jgi:acyl carrier protein
MDDKLRQKIAGELNVDPAELTTDTRLQDLEYWDSVMVLSLMWIISESVGKEVLPDEMLDIHTFGDIEALVASKLS